MKFFLNSVMFISYALFSGMGLIVMKLSITNFKFTYSNVLHLLVNKLFIGGFILYFLGFLSWIFILSKFKLNIAFPIGMSLFFIVSSIGSYFILKENFSVNILIGTSVCLFGIIIIALK